MTRRGCAMLLSRRTLLILALATVVLGASFFAIGLRNASADPIVRRAEVAVADWPVGEPPLEVLFIADLHVAGPDTPPERLRAVFERLNALEADLVLVGGDLVSDKLLSTRWY